MKQFFLLFLLTSALIACSNNEQVEELPPPQDIFIRIENASDFTYENLLVKFIQDYDYGTLNPGELSAYQEYARAYRYAYVKLEANGQEYVLQPIDYVGETELSAGYYSYIISLNESLTGLTLEFRED